MGSLASPTQLVAAMGPWLCTTKQGLWLRQIPLAEQTLCIGWLLFSAPEYDLDDIRRTIKQATGVEVALRFRIINDGLPRHTIRTGPRIKAIHMEVEKETSSNKCKSIANLYSSTAQIFPLGIKMRLVPEINSLTNPDAHAQAVQLQALQAKFLNRSVTSRLGIPLETKYGKKYTTHSGPFLVIQLTEAS